MFVNIVHKKISIALIMILIFLGCSLFANYSLAADTAVDTSARSDGYLGNLYIGPYWTSEDTGYIIFSDSSVNLVYRKTTDGGATWGSKVTIFVGSVVNLAIWFDQETPGDTGDLLHIAWLDQAANTAYYQVLDTSDDSLGTQRIVDSGITVNYNPKNNRIALTKTLSGNIIYALSTQTEIECYKSDDNFATSNTGIADVFETATQEDLVLLYPANTGDDNDAVAIYIDRSSTDLSLKMYDDSADSWTETDVDTDVDALYSDYYNIDASVRHSDNHILVAYHSNDDSAGDDLRTADINPNSISAPSITSKTNIFTNQSESNQAAVLINQQNNDVYVAYTKGGTWQTAVDIVYHKSTDNMTTWSSEQEYSEATADDNRIVNAGRTVGSNGGRFQPVFFNDDLNDIFVNLVNDVAIAVAQPTVTIAVNNSSVTEDGVSPIITATLSSTYTSDVTVNLSFSGTATGGGTDYTASSSSIVVSSGSLTGTMTIDPEEDLLFESDETVIVDVASVTNGTESGTQQVTITITNIDSVGPTVSLTELSPDPHTILTPTITGSATDVGGGTVSSVEYQVDGTSGTWTGCVSDDGVMDETTEEFSCSLATLTAGLHTIYVRSTDNSSNIGANDTDEFTIVTGGTPVTVFSTPIAVPVGGFSAKSVVINNNIASLEFNAGADIKYVAISKLDNFNGVDLIPYSDIQQYKLDNNINNLYIKFYNNYGYASDVIKLNLNNNKSNSKNNVSQNNNSNNRGLSNNIGFGCYVPSTKVLGKKIVKLHSSTKQLPIPTNLKQTNKSINTEQKTKKSVVHKIKNNGEHKVNDNLNNNNNYKFTYGLGLGMSDIAVRKLQIILSNYPDVYPEKLITGYFGGLTQTAVQKFQMKYNIVNNDSDQGYGYVGPKTRAMLNSF